MVEGDKGECRSRGRMETLRGVKRAQPPVRCKAIFKNNKKGYMAPKNKPPAKEPRKKPEEPPKEIARRTEGERNPTASEFV